MEVESFVASALNGTLWNPECQQTQAPLPSEVPVTFQSPFLPLLTEEAKEGIKNSFAEAVDNGKGWSVTLSSSRVLSAAAPAPPPPSKAKSSFKAAPPSSSSSTRAPPPAPSVILTLRPLTFHGELLKDGSIVAFAARAATTCTVRGLATTFSPTATVIETVAWVEGAKEQEGKEGKEG
eukprot:CAMPEP_0175061482 /NCGR_PEP_ID=MMETSP0052_2-20121109/13609_1 /TAXON_ID=51329 ORGANISM="Polytomella parva, Strain SAG 63-3" /NCGR_SAMPLE_ID=MMETSP0052_2 /ASSEMBLY_ACC=CAM_ASM_000194 /LENGTH=178 /DNA_ID=CAMNT_0016327341 /DNA_START=85 /DNA_END=619 /DNA_ORIENTATION=-